MNKINEVILKTIIYADIFDYPLTIDEIKRFLIKTSNRHSGLLALPALNEVEGSLPNVSRIRFWNRFALHQTVRGFVSQNDEEMLKQVQHDGHIETDGKYFFLKNRKEIVELRKKKEKWSREKLKIAAKAAFWLKLIPWVKMAGITGALAMNNSDQNDDIDLLIISSKKRIWLTRLLSTVLIEFFGVRRHPPQSKSKTKLRNCYILSKPQFPKFKNKICLNMYLDEAHLAVPLKERDLFTAHEVVQVKPLWDKDGIYNKFLRKNLWVKKYLPNAFPSHAEFSSASERIPETSSGQALNQVQDDVIENLAKNFQLWYMKSRRTTEVISDGVIRFHPQDARKWVLEKYNRKLGQLGIIS